MIFAKKQREAAMAFSDYGLPTNWPLFDRLVGRHRRDLSSPKKAVFLEWNPVLKDGALMGLVAFSKAKDWEGFSLRYYIRKDNEGKRHVWDLKSKGGETCIREKTKVPSHYTIQEALEACEEFEWEFMKTCFDEFDRLPEGNK